MITVPLWLAVGVVIVVAALFVRIYVRYRRNMRKVAFMFNAIDNNDLSFSFATHGVSSTDALLNRSLNRIKLILAHARDEAVEREKYYEHIMDAAGTGLLVVDAAGHILQHNTAALRLLRREALTHIDQVRQRLADGALSVRETYTMLRGERVRIMAVSDIDGELSAREVDSWIKLIRVLTHEIMNTVTPITSLSQTLLQNATGEQREGLATISQTGTELMAFVERYRQFTHVPQPQPRLFYVRPFAERMARLVALPVEVDVRPHDLLAYADEGLMGRVVTNLLKNAAEAVASARADDTQVAPAGSASPAPSQSRCRAAHIWIDAYTGDDDSVVIDIGDDAGCIDADVAQHIFVPFFTTKPTGSGIGLPLARQIMRVSGGTLSLVQDRERDTVVLRMKL